MTPSLNIGFLVLSHFPALAGAEMANHFLAGELHKKEGVNASVAMRNMRYKFKKSMYGYPVYRPFKLWKYERTFRKWSRQRMIRKEKVNLLFGSTVHTGGAYAHEMSKKFKIPYVVQAHGDDVLKIPEINHGVTLNPEVDKRVNAILKDALHVFCVSSVLKECVISRGIDASRITVIPNGVCYQKIQAIPYTDLRIQYGFQPDDFIILTVGRNVKYKRLDLILEAFEKLEQKYQKLRWVIVGHNPDFAATIQDKSYRDKIFFTGPIPAKPEDRFNPPFPELINHFRMADVFISSSIIEAFGITSLEALACGTPILVSKNNGIRDILDEELHGKVFGDTSQELILELENFMNKQDHYQSQSNRIIRSIENYDWVNIADAYLPILNKII